MKKIVNPCTCKDGDKYHSAFARIEFNDGRLSLVGVVGPRHNGDCAGSAGQCVDEISRGEPAGGWGASMLEKFCRLWERWHLNDMNPHCEHQKALGWDELAKIPVTLTHYQLTHDAIKLRAEAEKAALSALREGVCFTPRSEQTFFATLPYFLDAYRELTVTEQKYYELKKALYPGAKGATETRRLGWIKPEDHPDGLLCKPCPVCGYKYGTAWKKETVPEDVIDWLFSLPSSKRTPAWV